MRLSEALVSADRGDALAVSGRLGERDCVPIRVGYVYVADTACISGRG